jgi:hypothetical protein
LGICQILGPPPNLQVERHGLWQEIAETVGFQYKSDADVERLLTQAATLRGAAGPTWEEGEREKASKKEQSKGVDTKGQEDKQDTATAEVDLTATAPTAAEPTTTSSTTAAADAGGKSNKTPAKGKGKGKGKNNADGDDSNGKKRKRRSGKSQAPEEISEGELVAYPPPKTPSVFGLSRE